MVELSTSRTWHASPRLLPAVARVGAAPPLLAQRRPSVQAPGTRPRGRPAPPPRRRRPPGPAPAAAPAPSPPPRTARTASHCRRTRGRRGCTLPCSPRPRRSTRSAPSPPAGRSPRPPWLQPWRRSRPRRPGVDCSPPPSNSRSPVKFTTSAPSSFNCLCLQLRHAYVHPHSPLAAPLTAGVTRANAFRRRHAPTPPPSSSPSSSQLRSVPASTS